jgi:GNAT superfamily N-acetyltransferase
MDFKISMSDVADDAVRRAIAAPLVSYNEAQAGPSGHRPLVLSVTDQAGAVIGGLWGATGYGWLYTQLLLVPERLRGQGMGSRLMADAEAEAMKRGCRNAWVDTQFGAKPFYERLGYSVFGELGDYPPGFARSFLRKQLG